MRRQTGRKSHATGWLPSLVTCFGTLSCRDGESRWSNLRLCFPALSEQQRSSIARRCFRNIARSGLDRSVLSKAELDDR